MTERIVIDVNTWVKWAANNRVQIWFKAFSDFDFEVYGSIVLIEELNDVLRRPFFRKISKDGIDIDAIVLAVTIGVIDVPYEAIDYLCPDPKDNYLIEAAVKSNAIIVSNDKHLLDWADCPVPVINLEQLRIIMNNLLNK